MKRPNLSEWVGKVSEIERVEIVSINTKYLVNLKLNKTFPQKKIVFYSKPLFEYNNNKYYAMRSFPIIQKGLSWTDKMDIYKILNKYGLGRLVKEWEYSKVPIRKRFIGMKIKINKIPYKDNGWLSFSFEGESDGN